MLAASGCFGKSTTSTGRSPTTRLTPPSSSHHARPDHHAGRGILSLSPLSQQGGPMHDQVVDAAIAEPKKRKVRKTARPASNSVVELVAGRYVKAVIRIWGAKVDEYLSAP